MIGFDIDDAEFEEVRRLVKAAAGITLGDAKRALVVARLGKRLRHHGFAAFRDYCELLRAADADGGEMKEFINCLTTNKTEFFREPHHFDWLRRTLIPELKERARAGGAKRIRLWSAGCSTGQEPYSIAMILADELGSSGWDIRILASDIDTQVLAEAERGEYPAEAAAQLPPELQRKYIEGSGSQIVVAPQIRALVAFRRINLIDPTWPIQIRFDAIFCRNVTIYFDRSTQERLYEHFVRHLEPHGYIVAGHSENLHWLPLLSPAGPTVYRAAAPVRARPARSFAPPPPARARDVAIQSGGYHAAAQPAVVRTVLGSCVAACLFDPERGVGGMNHFMLPDGCETGWAPTRFGTHAMEALIEALARAGADRRRLQAKVFGGAHVLVAARANPIPDANVAFVRHYLAEQGIPIVSERLGGRQPMLVRFETHTGRAFVRLVDRAQSQVFVEEERQYRDALNAAARESESQLRAAGGIE